MAEVEFSDVSKTFGDHTVIPGLDLRVRDGELLVLLGPSGCGKSTLLRLLAGLEPATGGTIRIGGRAVDALGPGARNVAMVFQNYALYPHKTVRGNLEFPLHMRALRRGERERRVLEAARVLGLEDLLDKRPAELSGGQRQRVAMGRAIVREPDAFLMDEPLSNLDARLRVQIRAEIGALQRRLGVTTLYVTHDQVEAMTLGDRVAVLRDGVIQQLGAPADLYRRPANLFVAGFLGSPPMNLFEPGVAAREAGRALRLGGRWVTPTGGIPERARYAGLRPEDLDLVDGHRDREVQLQGLVRAVEVLGHERIVYVDTGDRMVDTLPGGVGPTEGAVAARLSGATTPEPGQTVALEAKPGCLYWFDEQGRAIDVGR
ncbi:putative sugar ABC transporter, ATP-binding protein [Thioalkalivibrio nitratireducens DSM 14787]|uniref:Sugar ABC transporter, ATP-binding protein n=1 Tax=Thioalkalivibrio nitratireducens (strain DSM 14787 / UNIQEM 213 / ALEN2) TaxID=1255043 RepID=L0DV45_THIND|nr:ABC transporter ATP-binding protein [Thioalkalivibrio nitratireducens]AGA32867.1 putative sugar ABC transporter, ATP-binding protein [Thioalkalivibrio nitratireducens DSM 14787]